MKRVTLSTLVVLLFAAPGVSASLIPPTQVANTPPWTAWITEAPQHVIPILSTHIAVGLDDSPYIAVTNNSADPVFISVFHRDLAGWKEIQSPTKADSTHSTIVEAFARAPNGNLGLFYLQMLADETAPLGLFFTEWNGNSWTTPETVTPLNFSLGYPYRPGLVYDAASEPHISFEDRVGLYYAERTLTTHAWTIQLLSTTVRTADNIAIDNEGTIHVAASGTAAVAPMHYFTRQSDGSWTDEIANPDCAGAATKLAIDHHDVPHIVCYGRGLFHLWKNASGWQAENLGRDDSGLGPALAIDSKNGIHISSQTTGAETLLSPCQLIYYYKSDGGAWTSALVDRTGTFEGSHSSIAIDSHDRPHISYAFDNSITGNELVQPTDFHYATPVSTIVGAAGQ